MHIAGSERVDEGDIPENLTGARLDVAVEVPVGPGTVVGLGASAHVRRLQVFLQPRRLEENPKRHAYSYRESAVSSCRAIMRLFSDRQPRAYVASSPSTSRPQVQCHASGMVVKLRTQRRVRASS
jgi:hypothetical protein